MDYEWPSKEIRKKAVRDGTFKPENIKPEYMAVHGTKIFLSLSETGGGIPVSLVSLSTFSNPSSPPPKLAPFPSWNMHKKDNCNSIQAARGIETDTEGTCVMWCSTKHQTITLRTSRTLSLNTS
ncbi:Hypothetical predicted protein [Cloeon dipterum]|uniref:Uncharacterized protein n=1 Tax=Cloeon dipterum TaxID=197152 RepID=A0A8S1DBF7_9INSE|nr:Hypothetical predicted protein [Cloeon dipterum]